MSRTHGNEPRHESDAEARFIPEKNQRSKYQTPHLAKYGHIQQITESNFVRGTMDNFLNVIMFGSR